MRIESIEAVAIDIPLTKNFGGSTYNVLKRSTVVTRMGTASPRSPATGSGVSSRPGAVDFVNFDVSECGGVTDWRRAAAVCAAAGVQMAHHEESQIARHLLAAVPHGTYVECFADPDRDPVWQAMWANRPAIKDGMMPVSPDPGFGLVLDEDMIRRYRVA
jgi:hypothetical protein